MQETAKGALGVESNLAVSEGPLTADSRILYQLETDQKTTKMILSEEGQKSRNRSSHSFASSSASTKAQSSSLWSCRWCHPLAFPPRKWPSPIAVRPAGHRCCDPTFSSLAGVSALNLKASCCPTFRYLIEVKSDVFEEED